MPRALLSVSDKTGLIEFGRGLERRGWTLLSTGGTAHALREAGIAVREVSELTGHPEIMDGRVKTLHPAVHAGLLGRAGHPGDEAEMSELGYETIDLIAVNLYPFQETIARPGVTVEEAIEQIDIGGPSMLRSAAKNHDRVWVVSEPADYTRVLVALDASDEKVGRHLRRELAARVFARSSRYDAAISAFLKDNAWPEHEGAAAASSSSEGAGSESTSIPETLDLKLKKSQSLRYGENPGQAAGFYQDEGSVSTNGLRQLQGKELSYNNLLDVDGALLALRPWDGDREVACAIIKHTTPCGLAVGATAEEAYRKALSTDAKSAFGSVVAFSGPVTVEAARELQGNFVEAIVAPEFSPEALELLAAKKNLRLLLTPPADASDNLDVRRVRGGYLVQERLQVELDESGWQIITERKPTELEMNDLRFAWRAIAPVKSNAILIARDGMTIGIGAGQMSRVDSAQIAVMKAKENGHQLDGSALASDAFFPFRDGVDAAAAAGVRAIIQPGGSVRDEEVIAAANEHGIAMIFTGQRLFRH